MKVDCKLFNLTEFEATKVAYQSLHLASTVRVYLQVAPKE